MSIKIIKEVSQKRRFIGRLNTKSDLLKSITDICTEKRITLGVFSIVGAIKKAKLGYYNQNKKKYVGDMVFNKKMEITSCIGNISLKDGKVFVHAHITLADKKGKCFGGHLMPGTQVFAAEFYIEELRGTVLKRKNDASTGLSLWA